MNASHSARVFRLELAAYKKLCASIGTPRALTCYLLVESNEWMQLLSLTVDPRHYREADAEEFAFDYLVTSCLQKNPRLPTEIDKRSIAISKFLKAEELCLQTNRRVRELREDGQSWPLQDRELILRIQQVIMKILSTHPRSQDLNYVEQHMAFGPGATSSLSGIVTQGAKYQNRTLDCTKELVSFRAFAFPDLWRTENHHINVVECSKLTTVPKNAKTDRVICIEPDLNIFVQKGVGALLREKLRVFGLDLNTQTHNQHAARRAWIDGLATVDLAAASDTISHEIVELLLPPAWVDLLGYCRVGKTLVDDKEITLEKWSSMGNGYTFELETLIFFATALAVTEETRHYDVLAYGDDIIIPIEAYPGLTRALKVLGFEVNEEKSFGYSLFHESCGADFFCGQNVRPFFFRSKHHDFESICYLYANSARRWANRRSGGYSCDSRLLPVWLHCFTAVTPKHRHQIPEGVGDTGFSADFDRALPEPARPTWGWAGWKFCFRQISSVEREVSVLGAYFAHLNGTRSSFSFGSEALRGRFRRATTATGYCLQWPNLGPWL